MNKLNELKEILPEHFSSTSKVWIYESDKIFTAKEENEINALLLQFTAQWKSHSAEVKGWAKIFFSKFIIVIADEKFNEVGGCSTDSMVRVIKEISSTYQTDLFNRQLITFLINDSLQSIPIQQVKYALSNGLIETDTLLFNNTITSKTSLENEWIIPLNKSWLWYRIAN